MFGILDSLCEKAFAKFQITKVIDVVPGGKTGQESIYNGIVVAHRHSSSASDIVLIHDGVRPMIDEDIITSCLSCVREHGNAITTTPAIETSLLMDGMDRSEISLTVRDV